MSLTTWPPPAAPTPDRLQWWLEARFGMSLHFGLYSIPARGEWVRSTERLSLEAYGRYFEQFDPSPDCCREWARLAKRMGAQYVVLTTKHHDGFCLFDSGLTSYSITATPYRRDLIKDYVEALRAEGLRVGFYYSLVDWQHPDYPAWQDRQHPLRHDPASQARDAEADWPRYQRYFHGQVEELCRNYGTIDLLVFDFSYWDFVDERWGAAELVQKIRALQPNVIFNDRLSREGIKQAEPPSWVGDFDHAEQDIPKGPVLNAAGQRVPWESWVTLSNSWCHAPYDRDYKQAGDIIRALVNCVSKGGNLMLNVAPDAKGHIDPEAASICAAIGDWLQRNGESIYGCTIADVPKPEWGRFTQRGRQLYAHLLEPVIGHINLPGLRGRVKDARLVASGAEAIICDYWNPGVQTFDDPDDIFVNLGPRIAATYPPPDRMDTVLGFTLTDESERQQLLERYRRDFEQALERRPF